MQKVQKEATLLTFLWSHNHTVDGDLLVISKYIMCVCMYRVLGVLLYRSSLYSLETGDVGFPFVCCEYVLLPLVNKEVTSAYSSTEYRRAGRDIKRK